MRGRGSLTADRQTDSRSLGHLVDRMAIVVRILLQLRTLRPVYSLPPFSPSLLIVRVVGTDEERSPVAVLIFRVSHLSRARTKTKRMISSNGPM